MRFADLVPSVASLLGHSEEHGQDDGPLDGGGYLLGTFHAQATWPW